MSLRGWSLTALTALLALAASGWLAPTNAAAQRRNAQEEEEEEEPPPEEAEEQEQVDAQGEVPAPPQQTPAQIRAELDRIRAQLSTEPTAREVTRVALRYFRLHPEALDSMRSAARLRATLPVVTGGYRYNDSRSSTAEVQQMTDPRTLDSNYRNRENGVSAGLTWDLREAIFNGDQVQIYSLVGVQRDIMLEVLRAYFTRRQLLLISRLRAPEDPIALTALQLRIEEFTAVLDSLTGEWFSRTVEERARQAGEPRDRGAEESQ